MNQWLRIGLFTGALLQAFCLPVQAQEWKPTRPVEIIVSSGPGGAADREARELQKFLQAVPGMPAVAVTNRPGGGGTVAWSSLQQKSGDAHFMSTLNVALLTNQILGSSPLKYQDLTPLAVLFREYIAVWTRTGSSITSTKDLLARLKRDPGSVSFGLSPARGNQNHIVIGMLAKAAGVDPKQLKIVVYSDGGQGTTAALGGHVDVWAGSVGGALPHAQSGAIRVFGISADQRPAGKASILPTFREQGIDAAYFAPRGLLAPGNLSAGQRAYWDQTLGGIVRSDEFKKVAEDHAWGIDFRGPAEARKYLDNEFEMLRRMLQELGVTSAKP